MIQDAGVAPQPVADKLLIDILRGASVEEDENLHDMWAALLANAAWLDRVEKVRPRVIATLQQMAPDEAELLNWIYDAPAPADGSDPLFTFTAQDLFNIYFLTLGFSTAVSYGVGTSSTCTDALYAAGFFAPVGDHRFIISPWGQYSVAVCRPPLIDTNFYGVVYMTRAALPVMRKQRSGCILQVSSVGGRLARPGSAAYHAAKWAVGGFTESIAQEVAPFGVKVCALEPGGMRTNWGARANKDTPDLLPDYEPSVGAVIKALSSYWGNEKSDPAKVAQLILRLVDSEHLPAHLLLGSDAVQYAGQAEITRAQEAEGWREVSVSTDVDANGPLPDIRF
jgi:hypothetical protein